MPSLGPGSVCHASRFSRREECGPGWFSARADALEEALVPEPLVEVYGPATQERSCTATRASIGKPLDDTSGHTVSTRWRFPPWESPPRRRHLLVATSDHAARRGYTGRYRALRYSKANHGDPHVAPPSTPRRSDLLIPRMRRCLPARQRMASSLGRWITTGCLRLGGREGAASWLVGPLRTARDRRAIAKAPGAET